MENFLRILIVSFYLLFPLSLYAEQRVIVGISQDKPLIFTDSDGTVKGVYADVLRYISQKEKWDIVYHSGTWSECLARLKDGHIDIVINIAYTKKRDQFYDFSQESFIANWAQVYVKYGSSSVQSFLDLKSKKMAVMKDDVYYNTFKLIDKYLKIGSVLVEVDDYDTILKLISNGEVDAGIVPHLFGKYHEASYDIEKSVLNFNPVELRFAVLKGKNRYLLTVIDRYLKDLKNRKNSIYYKSLDLWLEGVNKVVFPTWLKPQWVVIGAVTFLIIAIGNYIFLRWQIRIKTDELKETISAKERIESELRIAHKIQKAIVPQIFPPLNQNSNFEIYAILKPAKEVGGDLYDFFFIDEHNLCFVIGDVSGKGVPAAFFMAVVKTLIKAIAKRVFSCHRERNEKPVEPHMILTEVNKEVALNNESCTFVSVFFGILHLPSGKLSYTNAGHNLPLVIYNGKKAEFLSGNGCTVIGVDENLVFKSATITLNPGDMIFLYTDGVTDSHNTYQEMFSDERLKKEVTLHRNENVREIVSSISEKIKNFSSGAKQFDDITIMALRFLKKYKK